MHFYYIICINAYNYMAHVFINREFLLRNLKFLFRCCERVKPIVSVIIQIYDAYGHVIVHTHIISKFNLEKHFKFQVSSTFPSFPPR